MTQKRQIYNGVNQTIRAIIGAIFVLVIAFSAISVCQSISKAWKVDITDQKIYTLSKGTKAILAKLNQPIKAKLYYAKTATLKAPDQIRYFNNYYQFVKSLLEEYVAASAGLVKLEIIDPRPFWDDEVVSLCCVLRRFRIIEDENLLLVLVVVIGFLVDMVIQ
ncbi:MAG: Gldg family protein, partial [Planctomycetota bacterium]|nr:Gldg family protein [Planctomycetota bacterium]